MVERKRIGILFVFGKIWVGGVYYLISLIQALNFLQEKDKPTIVLFYNEDSKTFINEIDYPYLEIVSLSDYNNRSYFTFLKSIFLNFNFFLNKLITENKIDGLFPVYNLAGRIKSSNKPKLIAWYPDLQHKVYPENFSKLNLITRSIRIKKILAKADTLVTSSYDVKKDFKKYYEIPQKLNIKVLQFVSIIHQISLPSRVEVLTKYEIDKPYFIISNQFYKHKNHEVVFRAISQVVKKRPLSLFVFTGVMEHYKNPEYIDYLKQIITQENIQNNIKILGFIPRSDQLALLKASESIIQPSKFEGWSTVIEDGKSLQVQIIASDIAVHREQLGEKGFYFDPESNTSLASIILSFYSNSFDKKAIFDNYDERIKKYAEDFISILN